MFALRLHVCVYMRADRWVSVCVCDPRSALVEPPGQQILSDRQSTLLGTHDHFHKQKLKLWIKILLL